MRQYGKYTQNERVIVTVRHGFGREAMVKALDGIVVSGGSKNVTVHYFDEDGEGFKDSFDIESGICNAKHSAHKMVMTTSAWHRYLAEKDIEDNFEVVDRQATRELTITVRVKGRENIWDAAQAKELQPEVVHLTFTQRGYASITLDTVEVVGPELLADESLSAYSISMQREVRCEHSDLRNPVQIGNALRNGLPEWTWALAEKVWPFGSSL